MAQRPPQSASTAAHGDRPPGYRHTQSWSPTRPCCASAALCQPALILLQPVPEAISPWPRLRGRSTVQYLLPARLAQPCQTPDGSLNALISHKRSWCVMQCCRYLMHAGTAICGTWRLRHLRVILGGCDGTPSGRLGCQHPSQRPLLLQGSLHVPLHIPKPFALKFT